MPFTTIDTDTDTDTARKPLILATAALTVFVAAAGLACVAEPDESEQRAATLMDAIDYAEPTDVEVLGASELEYDGEVCSLEARPAALIGVIDQHGRSLSGLADDVALLYTHREPSGEWSDPAEGLCIDADCQRWAIGYAQPGEYVVGAFACGDYELGRFRVGMTEDGCHVDTVSARLQLDLAPACLSEDVVDAEPCDSSEPVNPSVVAMTGVIRGDLVIPQPPSELSLQHRSEDEPDSMDCLDEDCTTHVSDDYGVSGEFRLRAELCGDLITRSVNVEPDVDGCGVETEWVSVYTDAQQCAVFDYDVE